MHTLQKIDAHAGARLRALREERGLSQQMLANLVDVSFQQIQKYENGKNRMGASRLFEVSQILGVSPETFFDGLPSKVTKQEMGNGLTDASALAAFASSREGRQLIDAFSKIENRVARRQVLKVIQTLGKST